MFNKTKVKKTKTEQLAILRHSCEHLLMQAMLRLWPGKILMSLGPATKNGFYADFETLDNLKITPTDFPKIEAEMHKIVQEKLLFKKYIINTKRARKLFANNPYKQELIDDIVHKKEPISIYYTGRDFVDLCRGPHVQNTGQLKHFKLLSVAGAYWRGSEKNKMLTRIYGTCFPTKKELDTYLKQRAEAQKRDHRRLGEELDLFIIDETVGPGLILWQPKGAILRKIIMDFALDTYLKNGYQLVFTPHIARIKLWQQSGHWDFYRESMFAPFKAENQLYSLKPMNCPLHVKIYNHKIKSYRDLPLRYTEMGTVYRFEKSGVLHGLTRVRGFTQDDAHIICRRDQLEEEISHALELTFYILKTFGFNKFKVKLSTRDPKEKGKFIGNDEDWQLAEKLLLQSLKKNKIPSLEEDRGGAAFYGPKIDVTINDAIGREWQLSTIQLDFNLPSRFQMRYIDQKGQARQPFMIHRALLGSLERFIGILIEHYAGAFPPWLAPVQVVILPITEKEIGPAKKIADQLSQANLRYELSSSNQTLSYRLRQAELQKIPYLLIVGQREVKENKMVLRRRGNKEQRTLTIKDFLAIVNKEIAKKKLL